MQVIENVNNKLVIKYGYTIKVKNMSYNKCSELNVQNNKLKKLIVFQIILYKQMITHIMRDN